MDANCSEAADNTARLALMLGYEQWEGAQC